MRGIDGKESPKSQEGRAVKPRVEKGEPVLLRDGTLGTHDTALIMLKTGYTCFLVSLLHFALKYFP